MPRPKNTSRLSTFLWYGLEFLVKAFELQLFLMLISWPLLLHWGIALTPASIIGNILMGPMIIAALGLSSFCALCALCHLPYGLPAQALELLTAWWGWSLEHLPCPAPLPAVEPPLILSLAMALSAVIIIKKIANQRTRIGTFLTTLCLWWLILSLLVPERLIKRIPCASDTLLLVRITGKTLLIDRSKARKRIAIATLIRTRLVPELYKNIGNTPLDGVLILHNTESVREFYNILGTVVPIKKLYT